MVGYRTFNPPPHGADQYNVEHIFDEHSLDHGMEDVVNTYANWVWAWGKWNQAVSNLGTQTVYKGPTEDEKKLVYGKVEHKKVEELLNACKNWHATKKSRRAEQSALDDGISKMAAAAGAFCNKLEFGLKP